MNKIKSIEDKHHNENHKSEFTCSCGCNHTDHKEDNNNADDEHNHSHSEGGIKAFLPIIISFILFLAGIFFQLYGFNRLIYLPLYIISSLISGVNIFKEAFLSIIKLNFNMNVLMSVAVIGAFIIGEYIEATLIVMLFSISNIIEDFTLDKAKRSINKLLEVKSKTAKVINNEEISEIPVENVEIGSIVLVKPSERIPIDGIVIEGLSNVDQSPITGESIPIKKQKDSEVFAGTININGILKIKVTKLFEDTVLKKIIYLVEHAISKKTKLENFINRFAKIYTPIVMVLCLFVAILPPLLFNGIWLDWIYKSLTLLLIGCPCAFIISTPVTIIGGITKASRNGILLKGGIYLEKFNNIKNVAFDKTGTLTYGKMKFNDVILLNGVSRTELYEIAYALEEHSEHPIAKAIISEKEKFNLSSNNKTITNFLIIEGKGVEGTIDNKKYYLGSHRFFHIIGLCNEEHHQTILEAEKQGQTIVMIGEENKLIGAVSISDVIRDGIKESISELRKNGIEHLVMLTGDNKKTAESIAKLSGIDIVHSELLPEEKVECVKTYSNIAMVGDGINDAPALAVADVGIAMGGGTDISIETADIVLMENDIHKISLLKRISKKTLRLIKQNIIIAFGIKGLFLVMTLLGLSSLWMAVIADVGASIIVILNGLRILRIRSN